MAACIVNCVVHARLSEFICEADAEESKKKQKGKNKKNGEKTIDKDWFDGRFAQGDGSNVRKRPSVQDAKQREVEKDKDANKDAKWGKAESGAKQKVGQNRKSSYKDAKQREVEKDKDANKDAKSKRLQKAVLALPIESKGRKAKRGSGEEDKDEQGPGGKGKNKNEDQKEVKKIKVLNLAWKAGQKNEKPGDPKRVKDTTQENINAFFGVDVMALLTASA